MRDQCRRDRRLVRRLLKGDEEASRQFFDEYAPRLYRFALKRLNFDEDAAEEVVQATLVRCVPRLKTYRGEAPLFSWLCTFCRREVGRVYRSRRAGRARANLVDEDPTVRLTLEQATASSAEDPEENLLRTELGGEVEATLGSLPPLYGKALRWKYADGLSVKEVAGRLAIGLVAAQSLLARARRAFRRSFLHSRRGRRKPSEAQRRADEG